ncbi:MAG TPA: hypothetical protein VEK57_21850 [Thermoanaerobaculia bacterium]|nr:hypothetical protein [Thermoanaerobaculia bacterium]
MKPKELKESRIPAIIGCAAYVAAAMKGYEITAALGYGYMGFNTRDVPGWTLAGAFGLAVLPSLVLPLNARKPSTVLLWLLYLIAYVPLAFVPMLSLQYYDPEATLRFGGFVGATFIGVILSTRIPRMELGTIPRPVAWTGIVLMALGLYGYLAATHGLSLKLVSLDEVYDVRSEFKDESARVGRIGTYAVFWLANVLNPLFIATGVSRRRPLLLAVGVLGQLVLFSITGFKTVLLSIFLIPAMSLLIGRKLHRTGFRMAWAAAGGFLLALTWTRLTTLIVRRLLVTGVVSGWYYEFFSQNPQVRMGNSIFRFIAEYPYHLPVPNLIAEKYLDSPTTSANGNLWADAFANFGFMGIAVWSVALALYLWAYDSAATGRNAKLCALLLVVPGMSVSNVALQTALLTHGLALLLLVVLLIPKKQEVHHRADNVATRDPLQFGPSAVRRSDLRKAMPLARG